MPTISSKHLPILLFLFILALSSLFAFRTPPWQAPDEPAHYAYVQHVAETGSAPILVAQCYNEAYKNDSVSSNFSTDIDFARFCYEGHQPPLFYYLAAPVYLLSGGSLLALRLFCALLGSTVVLVAWQIVYRAGGDSWLALATAALVGLVPQYLAIIGSLNNDALTFLIVALVVWQLIALLKPVEGAIRAIERPLRHWARLAVLIGLALLTKTLAWVVLPLVGVTVLMMAYEEAKHGGIEQGLREIKGSQEQGLGEIKGSQEQGLREKKTKTLSPVSSQQSPVSSLQSPVSSYQSAVSSLQSPATNPQSPITTLQSPVTTLQSPITNLQSLITRGLLVGFIVLLFIVPWFARNMLIYGGMDVLGLGRHDEIAVGQPRTVDEIAVRGVWGTVMNGLETTFNSFWGQFGWMKAPLQSQEYQLLVFFSLAAFAGLLIWLVRRGWRAWGIDGHVVLLFALWIATNASLLVYYNLEFVQYQGRYLFSSLIPLAFFMMIGLAAWLKPRWHPLPWGALLLYLLYLDYLAIMERLPGMMNY